VIASLLTQLQPLHIRRRIDTFREASWLVSIVTLVAGKQTYIMDVITQDSLYGKIPWPESANKLYRQRDRLLLAKLVPTFANGGYIPYMCHFFYRLSLFTVCTSTFSKLVQGS
jgi:hypothetical protein